MELVRFDMQAMENLEISGLEYQQGTLAGYETREYLLEKWQRKCAYCGKEGVPLQVEHIVPRAKGGSNRVSNLTLACEPCNTKKGTLDLPAFLKKKPDVLKRIEAQAKVSLKDAAAVNATRFALLERLRAVGLPIECGSGGRTKYNRVMRNLPKTHWLDAACVRPVRPKSCRLQECIPCSSRRAGMGVGACATSIRSVSLVLLPKGRKKYRASRRAISPGPSSRRAKSRGSMWAESWCALRARLISPPGVRVLPAWMCAFSATSTVQMAIATRQEKAMQIPRPIHPEIRNGHSSPA